MSNLKIYQQKRKFSKTLEPQGKVLKTSKNRFVVQEHHATNLHYDFRLELDGVLKSWAVPKGLPEKNGIKRLAVQTEDHPVNYINFEGIIPEGNYGAGTVKIWDKGKFKLTSRTKDALEFELKGKKLKGDHIMIKMKNASFGKKGKNWLLFKK